MAPPQKYQVAPGDQFGRLTVRREASISRRGRTERAALCTCSCGSKHALIIELSKLFTGHTASCGCVHRESIAEIGRTASAIVHGFASHPLYATYTGMIQRCYNPNATHFDCYGGRNISVCERWHNIRLFIRDIERLLGPRPRGMTLDRINNDGNYEPGNVRWATRSVQAANRRPRLRDNKGRYL